MNDDRAGTGSKTDAGQMTDRTIERGVKAVPATAANPAVRPWTSDFLLPSISFRKPKRT